MRQIEHDAGEAKNVAVRAWNKFGNDWTMNLAAMLSYNVLTSFFPLVLALITILALLPSVTGNTDAVVRQINSILPGNVSSQIDVHSWLTSVNGHSGLLGIVSILGLVWGGSNLFGAIESAFAVIFRVKTRGFLDQKIMAIVMILVLVVLLPISFVSTFFISAASSTLGKVLPGALSGGFAVAVSLAVSLGSLFVLFAAIYTVVPNLPIRWRYAWRGALVAAIAMWVINTLFPVYTAHFLSTKQYGGAALAAALATITWFWFFSLVLLIGAQANAMVMGIGPWKYDLARELMEARIATTSGQPTAMAALESKKDPRVMQTPVGLARDSRDVEDPAKHRAAGNARDTRTRVPGRAAQREASATTRPPTKATSGARGMGIPAPRHEMRDAQPAQRTDASLLALGSAPGGVRMGSQDAVLGPRPLRMGILVLGALMGLFSGLRGTRRSAHPR